MGKIEIIAVVLAIVIIAFRLYQKYFKKEKGAQESVSKGSSGPLSGSSSGDDDYEPYSNQ